MGDRKESDDPVATHAGLGAALGVAFGAGVGTALGVALDNVGVGVALAGC